MLHGRAAERALIDRMLAAARDGRSGALVLRGPAGIGKSALLGHAAEAAAGFQVVRAEGVEFEAELPFAGLHLLLSPVLDRIDRLPAPQAEALRGAFGLTAAAAGDRFLVGLAVLSLLAELAEDGPLLCLVDDAQWFDRSSAEALGFAARRLNREGVLLLFGVRDAGGPHGPAGLAGLPAHRLDGLDAPAAAALLDERTPGLAPRVRARILAETEGNPLALIELPLALSAEQRAGELLPLSYNLGPLPLTERVRTAFGAQAARLGEPAAALLLVAAVEETGDLSTVLAAAALLGAGPAELEEAERPGLLVVGDAAVSFKHPLARAAVLQGAPLTRRLAAHRALAEALAGSGLPDAGDRAAWHRAAAATGPDEAVAAALEATARRAATRTGHAAQAAALERAAELTPDPGERARRLAGAAEAAVAAGDLHRASAIARRASAGPADAPLRARLTQVRAAVEFEFGSPRTAARLLLDGAAEASGPAVVPMLAEAVRNGYFSGDADLAGQAADRLLAAAGASPFATGLAGLARLMTGDAARAVPAMRAMTAFALGPPRPALGVGERLIAGAMGLITGDDDAAREMFLALVADARERSLIGWLPIALEHLALAEFFGGRVRDAHVHAEEGLVLADSTGQAHRMDHLRCVLAWAAALTGDEARCRGLAEAAIGPALDRHAVRTAAWGTMALGLLDVGLGRYEQALARLETAAAGPLTAHYAVTYFAPDQVEAAVRTGRPDRAARPLGRFRDWAAVAGQPWAEAVAHRCAALLATGGTAEEHYAEAVRLHLKGGRPFERARTDLLYGEWLRRAQRKADARARLRPALETFERLGARPWAERAAAELRATGAPGPAAPGRSRLDRLTPQELQVVRLAAQGLSNRDIAGQLFLSARTVGYHLYKAYPKLGVAGRGELAALLGAEEAPGR
ncbi:helix-turn-helix transcriptional regulator [Actinomadura macrotermitis]|uniref:helix-turn-helix transcriptional regulator n=1 Tax=Actinomadura macrotermitis TaxID=2585200 RepID=UPI001295F27E|nr:LuxR family transcriptional regulator [Actinomadura macrotermitis]